MTYDCHPYPSINFFHNIAAYVFIRRPICSDKTYPALTEDDTTSGTLEDHGERTKRLSEKRHSTLESSVLFSLSPLLASKPASQYITLISMYPLK